MQKYIVLYCMPIGGLEDWMKTPAEERKAQEDALKTKWDVWMAANKAMMTGPTAGVGKTKRVTTQGVADAKNDIMMYSIVQGESHEEVAKFFEGHPHLEIPGAWIDISTANYLPGMEA
ncbi:MAG: hypothetical protein AAB431_01675 [Patescibacteria group bacterium]